MVRVLDQIQPFVGDMRAEATVGDQTAPCPDPVGQALRPTRMMGRFGIGQPAISVLPDPVQCLARGAGHQQGNRPGHRLGQQLYALQRAQCRVDMQGTVLHQLADIRHRCSEAFPALGVLQAIRRKLHRTVAGGDAQHQPPTGQLVDGGGRLGQIDRMPQREDRTARGQRKPLGTRRQEGQIGKGIEHLPGIAKQRIKQGHIAYPGRGEAVAVQLAHQIGLPGQHLHVAMIEAEGQEHTQRQRPLAEHALVAGVAGERRCGCARQRRLHRGDISQQGHRGRSWVRGRWPVRGAAPHAVRRAAATCARATHSGAGRH
ncbi:hypothetical protein D3C71_1069210 [compost metagenome]